jgi:phospholipid N-methyltransferase
MNENLHFLRAILKHPLKVGAIAPSSPELAQMMLSNIEPSSEKIILELGVGTGAITKLIQEKIPNRESYLGIELDHGLVQRLNNRFPDLNIVCGNASEAYDIHRETGLGKPGYILSCLPFVTLPNVVVKQILAQVERFMDDGCTFTTFQYAHGYYTPAALKLREFMRDRYGKSQRSPLVMKNVPPAYTLTWSTT